MWPSKWSNLELVAVLEHGVFLLDSKPRLLIFGSFEDLVGEVPEVGVGWNEVLVGGVLPHEGLAEDHDVVASSEGVWEVEDSLHYDL